MTESDSRRGALLVVAPEGRDSSVVAGLLTEAGIDVRTERSGGGLIEAILSGDAAGAILTDEAIGHIGFARLREAVEKQPPWSDFPFILLVRRGQGSRRHFPNLEDEFNATLLERPLHPASLVSAARSIIRARRRQRLAARHLEDLEAARGELRALASSLESKVRDRTRDLATANDRLTAEIAERERAEARLVQAQKMEAVGQLTGGIAHDFNNLLTAVIGSLDLLLRRLDDERSQRLARNAILAAERGAKVTAQLLAFSRRQRLSPEPVDPNEVVTTMSDLLSRSLGPRIVLETRLEPGLWTALVDRTQLEMMILNLSINARDAMPSGGSLRIATSNIGKVPPDLRSDLRDAAYVCIAVSDTGVGMPQDVLDRAFEPFFTTKGPGKGTGLGLAQLYGFARQSGGTVRIESREGEGTTVTIYLPRTESIPEAAPEEAKGPAAAASARIVLVDDDHDVREAAAAMIEELGYSLTAFSRGEEALEAIGKEDFDLLITDVMMPGLNGVELAAKVREIRPEIGLLFATGYADIEEFGKELDSSQLIRKPFRMNDLAARIAAALDGLGAKRAGVIDLDKARDERNAK